MTYKKRFKNDSKRRNAQGGSGNRSASKKTKSFDLQRLISQVKPEVSEPTMQAEVATTFKELNLDTKLLQLLEKRGFEKPTPIQEGTFKHAIAGRDILGIANTGTGKTAAFLLPLIQQLLTGKHFETLVVVPTRELAQQVEKEFVMLTKGLPFYSVCLIGGTNINTDVKNLRKKNHVIIATPGRLLDLKARGAVRLQPIEVLVLDEFDRMLDMGFVRDIQKIIAAMSSRRQTMLFSATLDKTQKQLISDILSNPFELKVSTGDTVSNRIRQEVIKVGNQNRMDVLMQLMSDESKRKVLLFAETKRQVDKLEKKLRAANISSDLIHGNKTQSHRVRALNKFRSDKIRVLVATDVAARGIDVAGISHVINFQQPLTEDSYIHRIGRTGRASDQGVAITLID